MRIENEGYHVFHDIIPLSRADIKTLIEAGNDITVEQYHSDGIPYSVHINDIDLTKDFIGGLKKEVMWDYEDVHSSIITKAFQKISENKNVLDLTTDDYLISR